VNVINPMNFDFINGNHYNVLFINARNFMIGICFYPRYCRLFFVSRPKISFSVNMI
jgi:hypothetical protein